MRRGARLVALAAVLALVSSCGDTSGTTEAKNPISAAPSVTDAAGASSAPAQPAGNAGLSAAKPHSSAVPSPPKAATGHRQVTFVNAEAQTLWIAAGQQTPKPALPVTGWVLPSGRTVTIDVPDQWNGRFWARTGCTFDASGAGHCQTGDCAGRFQCRQYGVIPATLAEFNFNAYMNLDFYDVSLVDGSNRPMWINIAAGDTKDPISAAGCAKNGCTRPVDCPAELRVAGGGCESPCGVFGTDQYCCRGQWAPRDKCRPEEWPVNYAAMFKRAEPFAYSYVDDDATSTFTCAGECGYRITWGSSP